MQTFLPLPDFSESLLCLDYRRLGKQRVESWQILSIITGEARSKAWTKHPAVLMWMGYENALILYYNLNLEEWERRGYNNVKLKPIKISKEVVYPPWFGDKQFHASHRSELLRKNYDYYSKFNWAEKPGMGYVWPVKKEE